MTYSDEELVAYLSGKARKELADAIESDLAQDVSLEDRLMALDPMGQPISAAFEHLEGPDEGAIEFPRPSQGSGERSTLLKLLPLVAAGVFGAAVAIALAPPSDDVIDWRVQVANYQALYSKNTVAQNQYSAEDLMQQTALAGQQIGLSGLQVIPSAGNGLTHVRTQTLQVNDIPLVQIVFRTDEGVPVALCGIPLGDATQSIEIGVGSMSKMKSASFDTASHSWLLIGGNDTDLIVENAKAFQSALNELDV